MGLEGVERELRGAFAEAERGVMAEKLAQYDVDVPKLVIDPKKSICHLGGSW